MVEVKVPEPIGEPLVSYHKDIENKRFDYEELKNFLEKVEKDLGGLVKKLDDKIMIFDYRLSIERAEDKEELGFMGGGMDLGVREAREYCLHDFKREYKRTLTNVLKKVGKQDSYLNIKIEMFGFGDKITHIVEAKDPYET